MSRCHPTVLAGVMLLGFSAPWPLPAIAGEPVKTVASPHPRERLEIDNDCLRLSLAYHEWEAGHAARARQLLKDTRPEQRDWVYDHLSHRFHQELRSITALEQRADGYPRGVRHVRFSPQGKQLIAACDDLRVKVWDAASGEKQLDIPQETWTVDYHPDGGQFFTGLSNSISVIDAITGKTVRRFSVDSAIAGIPLRVECSQDGKLVAAMDTTGGVRVWNVQTGECDHHFQDTTSIFRFSPDGSRLAVVRQWSDHDLGIQQSEILLQDLRPGGAKKPLALRCRRSILRIEALAFSPDGKQLAAPCRTTGNTSPITVFDLATSNIRYELPGHAGRVNSVTYSPDGRRLATAGADQTVRIWDAHTEKELFVFRGHTGPISSVAFSPDGLQCASAASDGQVKLWDLTGSPVAYEYNPGYLPQFGQVRALAGEGLVTLGQQYDEKLQENVPCLQVRRSRTGAVRKTVTLPRLAFVSHVAMSHHGNYLATSFFVRPTGHRLLVWDLAGKHPQPVIDREVDAPLWLAFSPDEKRLAILSARWQMDSRKTDIEMELVETHTGRHLHSEKSRLDGSCTATSVEYSRDGAHVAASFSVGKEFSRWQGATVLWRADTAKELAVLHEPQGAVRGFDISPNGDSLVTAVDRRDQTPQGMIQVWNLKRNERSLSIAAHDAATEDVAYSLSGKLIVSSGRDGREGRGQIRFWQADSGERQLSLDLSAESSLTRLEFIGPDHSLLALDSHGAVRLLENESLSPEVRYERAAVTLLSDIAASGRIAGPLLASEKRERLAALPLHDEVRRRAGEMVEQVPDNPERLARWSWQASQQPDESPDRYERARLLAEIAGQRQPEAANPRVIQALAEYRLKQFQRSWETLAKADELIAGGAANLSLRAMLQQQLGKHDEAVKTLALVQQATQAKKPVPFQARQLLVEAKETIQTE